MRGRGWWLSIILPVWWIGAAHAAPVDLSLHAPTSPVTVNAQFSVTIVAETALGESQSLAGLSALLRWNPLDFALLGVTDNGPYAWLWSRFPDDSALDGLNNTWADGDAMYEALANFASPAVATSAGLLVTTLEFQALRPVHDGAIDVPAALGQWSRSQVFGADEPNQDVTGVLRGATVTVIPEPGAVLLWASLLSAVVLKEKGTSLILIILKALGVCASSARRGENQ